MARGNLQRQGVVAGALGPTRGGVVWERKFGNKEGILATPAVVGNRLYVASADLWGLGSSKLYCLDADTGGKVWELEPEEFRPTFSSPVVVGSRLVCGEGLHDTKDARLICVDIADERQPKVLWTFAANFHVECTPVIAGDRVFVNAGDNGVFCVDLETAGKSGTWAARTTPMRIPTPRSLWQSTTARCMSDWGVAATPWSSSTPRPARSCGG
jgi:outer membrane protein assembly factor BamB